MTNHYSQKVFIQALTFQAQNRHRHRGPSGSRRSDFFNWRVWRVGPNRM